MKANHILFSALAVTLVSAYTLSPSDLISHSKITNRIPASAEEKKPEADLVQCKSEAKGEKLEKDIKSSTQDIEAVLKEIDELKKENKELKEKVSSKEEKKKKKDKEDKEIESTDMIGLMSQITTMFSVQMQSQMQVQLQMMDMLSQMQFNSAPQYTWDWSNNRHSYVVQEDVLGLGSYGIGLQAPRYWEQSTYSNPYAGILTRQPAQQSDSFSFGQIPQANFLRGFDFNQTPSQPSQSIMPEMRRQEIPQQDMPKQAEPLPAASWTI